MLRALSLAWLLALTAPLTAAAQGEDPEAHRARYARARACAIAGDNRCVIRELRGHCVAARDFELLIAAMRAAGGYDRDVENQLRTYCSRFPSSCRRLPPARPRYWSLPYL